jgi:hypothetical protein
MPLAQIDQPVPSPPRVEFALTVRRLSPGSCCRIVTFRAVATGAQLKSRRVSLGFAWSYSAAFVLTSVLSAPSRMGPVQLANGSSNGLRPIIFPAVGVGQGARDCH